MNPINTQKLLFIRRHFEKSLEMAGKATSGPWKRDLFYIDAHECQIVKCGTHRTEDAKDYANASFIATSRTDCPMAMEMVIEAIQALTLLDSFNGSISGEAIKAIISRFESTHGIITSEQVEAL